MTIGTYILVSLIKIVIALCDYEGKAPQLSPQLIDEACHAYFVGNA